MSPRSRRVAVDAAEGAEVTIKIQRITLSSELSCSCGGPLVAVAFQVGCHRCGKQYAVELTELVESDTPARSTP